MSDKEKIKVLRGALLGLLDASNANMADARMNAHYAYCATANEDQRAFAMIRANGIALALKHEKPETYEDAIRAYGRNILKRT